MIGKLIRKILIFLLVAVAAFSAYKYIRLKVEYKIGEKTYKELENFVHLEGYEPDDGDVAEGEQQEKEPYVDTLMLKGINPDFVGWIHIPNTNVNYPIVHGKDNSAYLTKTFVGNENPAGSIFMDCGNSGYWNDYNTVIYGHNMKNKSMFAHVESYKDQTWYDAHPTGLLITEFGSFQLQFFAGYSAKTDSRAWELDFADDGAFTQWLETAKENSAFQSNITPTAQDRVVTLSTCAYDDTNVRFVLLAIMKPI